MLKGLEAMKNIQCLFPYLKNCFAITSGLESWLSLYPNSIAFSEPRVFSVINDTFILNKPFYRLLHYTLNDSIIPSRFVSVVIKDVAATEVGYWIAWRFVTDNWSSLNDRYDNNFFVISVWIALLIVIPNGEKVIFLHMEASSGTMSQSIAEDRQGT